MAFTGPNESTPYYRPVAPEVPVAPREPQGERLGGNILSAMTQMALQRERAQLEQQQMLQQADLQSQRLQYQDKWQKQDHDIAKEQLKSIDNYRRGTSGDNFGNPKWRAQQAAELAAKNAELAEQRKSSVDAATLKGIKELQDSGLHDEEKWVTDPVGQLEHYQNWMGRWGDAVDSGQLTQTAKDLTARAAKLTIPIKWGANYVEPNVTEDGKRIEGHYTGGNLHQVPLLDFLQQWKNNPEMRPELQTAVAGGGNTHIIDRIEQGTGEITKRSVIKGTNIGRKVETIPEVPTRIIHKIEFNPDVQGIMSRAGTANLQKGENQLPPELQKPLEKQHTLDGGGGGQSAEWARAIEWANANPDDPRSQQILSAAGR